MPRLHQARFLVFALAGAAAFVAQPAAALTYSSCVAAIRSDPGAALQAAEAWVQAGGDAAAEHCAVLAEVELNRLAAAAERLGRLIDRTADGDEAAAMLSQLGNIRLLDGKPDLAAEALTRALAQTPNNRSLLVDRARAYAAMAQWSKATTDLDAAVQIDNSDPDTLLLYATALRQLGRFDQAKKAIERADGIFPDDPDILLERGRIRLLTKDRKGAAADWRRVVALPDAAPGVRAAAAASLKALKAK